MPFIYATSSFAIVIIWIMANYSHYSHRLASLTIVSFSVLFGMTSKCHPVLIVMCTVYLP